MRILSVFLGVLLSILVSGCSTIDEKALADLQSLNAIVKKEAVNRISRSQGLPLNLIDSLVSRTNEEKAVVILVELLRSGEESKEMELSIVKALGQLGKRTEVPVSPLIEKLKDKDPRMRAQVVEALAKTKNKKASTALVKLLGEETGKYPIIWAIGEIGDNRAIPALNRLLASDDRYVRHNAYRALAKIGNDQVSSDSNTRGVLDIGRVAFQKYKEMMTFMFKKMSGFKVLREDTAYALISDPDIDRPGSR